MIRFELKPGAKPKREAKAKPVAKKKVGRRKGGKAKASRKPVTGP
jgi:hypothetical protein